MKTKFFTLLAITGLFVFSQCKTPMYKLQKTVSFSIKDAYYQDWTGGQPGNSGTLLSVNVLNADEIQPDSIYFQNRIEKIDVKSSKEGVLWVANFRKVVRKDINMKENPSGEYGNPVPEKENFPFELSEGEAVIQYSLNNKKYYYLISNIKQKEPLFYPAARPKNN